MIKKLVITAAVGASVFGVAAASASSLGIAGGGSFGKGVAQQSNAISATCNSGSVEMYLNTVSGDRGADVSSVSLAQQSISATCQGALAQAVVVFDGGTAYSQKLRLPNNGLDVDLALPAGVDAQKVISTTVTFADNIGGPANELVRTAPVAS